MALGNEVMLGWRVKDFCKVFGIKMLTKHEWSEGEKSFEFKEAVETLLPKTAFDTAHKNALVKSGIAKNLRKPSEYPFNADDRYVEGDTSKGKRTFALLSMEVAGDEIELGDRYPDDFIVGISISGRYVPTYLDWRDPNGTLDTVSLDEMAKEIRIIRREIEKAEPRFKTAKFYVKMKFY